METTKKTLPDCAYVANEPSIKEIERMSISDPEILQFSLLQKGLQAATQKNYGISYCSAIGLAAAIPMTRRFLALANSFKRRIKIIFLGTAACNVPLWLASQGISVEIIEDDPERNAWAKMLGDYFFKNINCEYQKTITSEPIFHVTDTQNLENYPSDSKCDIFWIGQDVSEITTFQNFDKILKTARNTVITSDIGLIGCPTPSTFTSNLWDSAQKNHLRSIILEKFLFFQPFEISSGRAPTDFFSQPEILVDTPTALNINSVAKNLGISLGEQVEIKQPISSVENVIRGFLQ